MFDDVESDGAVGEDEPCFLREDVVDAAIFVVSAVSPRRMFGDHAKGLHPVREAGLEKCVNADE